MGKPSDISEDTEETWPAIMRVGTVARYLDCSTSTVNKLISEGAFPAVKYGPGEGMRGVRRQEVDAYIESLSPEFGYPEFEFELSRSAPQRVKGPGSRMLFLKAAIRYFRDDRDSWKRRALYSERYLSQAERRLMDSLDRLLPDEPPSKPQRSTQTSTPPRYRAANEEVLPTKPETAEEFVENARRTMASDTLTIPVRSRPGEFQTLSAVEVAKRIAALWELPSGVRGKLVFGGWRSLDELAQATDEELLATEGITASMVKTIRKHIPQVRAREKSR